MEYLIFYYGTCLMGLVSIVSMLAIYTSNKRVLKESKNPAQAKEKWTANFIAEHQKLLKDNIQIHNPAVYVMKRMRGRKIGPCSMHQIKGISWITLCLSFLFAGGQFFLLGEGRDKVVRLFPLKAELPAMSLTVFTTIGLGIVLLGLKILTGTGYHEEEIETNLLDYVENRCKEPAKVVPIKKTAKHVENSKKDEVLKEIERGILETAATDNRYAHLLDKEEKAIVKNVVKEFLAGSQKK